MSFQLPSVKPKPTLSPENLDPGNAASFELPNLMLTGLANQSKSAQNDHPLMQSESNYRRNRQQLNDVMLRNTQGLHAPLRIHMELAAARKVGHLPFLHSHNVMLDNLTGRDIEMGPEDIFNSGEFPETMGMPHAMVERQLGIL